MTMYRPDKKYYEPLNRLLFKYGIPYVFDWSIPPIQQIEFIKKAMNGMMIEIEEQTKIIQEFIKAFDENLDITVEQIMNTWYDNGKLAELINETLLNSKADKDDLNKLKERVSTLLSVKDFGAIGDGITDDTQAFKDAIASNRDFFIPSGVYNIEDFATPENVTITGVDNPTLKLRGATGKNIVVGLGNNVNIKGIIFDCVITSMEWNRTDITKKKNVKIENCSFIGFRHNSDKPNAWGIYIQESDNVIIDNCYFEKNSQSDIAIVEKSTNIKITNCTGSALHINFEPNTHTSKCSVEMSNMKMDKLSLIETSWHKDTANITVTNCVINNLVYIGASVKFVNCVIKSVRNTYGNVLVGGKLKNEMTLAYGKNMIDDNFLDYIGGDWSGYSATQIKTVLIRDKESIIINPNNVSAYVSLTHKKIDVKPNTLYAFRIKGYRIKEVVGGFAGWIGRITLFDGVNQTAKNEVTAFKDNKDNDEYVVFVNTGQANSIELNINNGNGNNSTNGYAIEHVAFSEVLLDRNGSDPLMKRDKRILSKEPIDLNNKYYVGDIKIVGGVAQTYDGDKWV